MLAVIVIMGVIALITTPIIIGVISSAKEQANRRSVDGLIRAGKNYLSESMMDASMAEKIRNQENLINEISYEGKGPEEGQLYVNEHSDVALAVKYGSKCYKKEYTGNVEILDYNVSTCRLNINIKKPEVQIVFDNVFNEQGWSNKNFNITISTTGYSGYGISYIKWCGTSNEVCEPTTEVSKSNFIIPISQETSGSKICAKAIDGFLNESEVVCSNVYKLDKTAPEFLGLTDIVINQDAVLDLESGVMLNDSLSGAESTFTFNPTDVNRSKAGEYTITYSGKDLAGNIGTGSRKVTVHTSAPSITFTPESGKINENGWSKTNLYVTINATDYSSYGIDKLVWCGTTNNTCIPTTEVNSSSQNILLQTENNNHHICAYAIDKFGQQSEITCSDAYRLDKTNPSFTGIEDITVSVGETLNLTSGVNVTDALSGINGTYSYAPTTINTSKTGSYPVTYTVSDLAGNSKQITRNIIVTSGNPTINFTAANGAINNNGWAKANFYVTVNSRDYSGHGIERVVWCGTTSNTCTPTAEVNASNQNVLISQESNNNRICAYAIDKGGHTGSTTCSDAYKLDKTAPTAGNATISGTLGNNGWYRSNVTLTKVDGSDSLSGHASTTISRTSVTGETAGTAVTITTTDLAGNTSTRTITIKIDKTAPTISGLTNISVSRGGSVNLTSGVSATDNLSGMNGTFTYSPTSIDASSAKTVTVTYRAKDKAGNTRTETRTVTVTNTTLANVIQNSPIVTSGSGIYKVGSEYRYRGASVNNYISINGQKYRVIALDNQGVKVITPNALSTTMPIDKYPSGRNNDNNTFCYGQDYCSAYSAVSGDFISLTRRGTVTQNSTLYTYLNSTGTDAEVVALRNKAKIATWNIGTITGGIYNVGLTTLKNQEANNKANFKMGLMNASDYLQASLDVACQNNPVDYSDDSKTCKNNNWLYLSTISSWTINPFTNNIGGITTVTWLVDNNFGFLNNRNCSNNYGVRPTAYLNANTVVIGGTGTESNPWIIQ